MNPLLGLNRFLLLPVLSVLRLHITQYDSTEGKVKPREAGSRSRQPCTKVPSRRSRIRSPRHSMRLPMNASSQMAA